MANSIPKQFIYAIEARQSKLVKIGFSTEPSKRIATLQTGCPEELLVVAIWEGSQADEHAIHSALREHRINGEWFTVNAEETRAFIDSFLKTRRVTLVQTSGVQEPTVTDSDNLSVHQRLERIIQAAECINASAIRGKTKNMAVEIKRIAARLARMP